MVAHKSVLFKKQCTVIHCNFFDMLRNVIFSSSSISAKEKVFFPVDFFSSYFLYKSVRIFTLGCNFICYFLTLSPQAHAALCVLSSMLTAMSSGDLLDYLRADSHTLVFIPTGAEMVAKDSILPWGQ